MKTKTIENLVKLGFSEYEAKAYVALLQEHPATGYQLSKISGIPRSMIYEVMGKLITRGTAMLLHKFGSTQYAPVPAEEYLSQLNRDYTELVADIKTDLTELDSASDMAYVWNIDGHNNMMAKAVEMISQAKNRIYLAVLPLTYPALKTTLEKAVGSGVRVVLYSSSELDLPGGRVVVSPLSEDDLKQDEGLGFVLVTDGQEVLIGERLSASNARASWTRSPLFVLIAEHHLRTDLYLPQILNLLGDKAKKVIHTDDYELFAQAFESRIKH